MIPSNKPPKGLSPVMARYLRRWRFDNKTLTTAIIDLATTGCVVIQEENGRFILKRQNTVARRPDESAVQEIMEDHNRFELDRKNRKAIRHMKRACRKTLESKKKLLVEKDFISFIYAFYIISLMFLLMLWTENVGWFLASAVAIGLIINIVIYNLVKGISEDGQKTRMQIENFRLFLEGSKKHHVKPIDPRERTLELFERYLPYAVALDVEEAWTAQFKELFGGLRVVGNAMGMSWYTVNDQIFQPGSANLTTTLIKPLTDAL